MIKEVIFFSYGDSKDVSTWSNVPYLFARTLEEKGIKVDRVDFKETGLAKYIGKLCYKVVKKTVLDTLFPGNDYDFSRTKFFRWYADRKIKNGVKIYANADLCIFMTFSFTNKFSSIPTLLFSDWTYNIHIMDRLRRKPYSFEKEYEEYESEVINSSEYVVSLFPVCADQMKKDYPTANINYLGGNVINSLYDEDLYENELREIKQRSQSILFIGSARKPEYVDAANMLLRSFGILSEDYPQLELHFIGMEYGDLDSTNNARVHFHGYLHKDVYSQRNTYYKLLRESKMVVNQSPLWGGYSSIIEAMYFYTPIIVAPFKDFVTEFGEDINFGLYNKEYDVDTLNSNICHLLETKNYWQICCAAHQRVKNYTWSAYVDRILGLVR